MVNKALHDAHEFVLWIHHNPDADSETVAKKFGELTTDAMEEVLAVYARVEMEKNWWRKEVV